MPDNMIALQIQPPAPIDFEGIRAKRNAMAYQNMLMQQAQRKTRAQDDTNLAYAAALQDDGNLDPARLSQELARSGVGAEIPGAREALFKADRARDEAGASNLALAQEVTRSMFAGLSNAKSGRDVMASAEAMAAMYPSIAPHLVDNLRDMPEDGDNFLKWRNETLLGLIDIDKQIKNQLISQEDESGQRVIAVPEYGPATATEVPGSRAGPKPRAKPSQLVWGRPDSTGKTTLLSVDKTTGVGTPVTIEDAGGGSAATALQTNPGAIKDSAFARTQPGYTGAIGGFATFETPEAGIAAQERLLSSSYLAKGFNTIGKIIDKYAPQGPENSAASVANYKAYVAKRAGIAEGEAIAEAQIPVVAAAMREFETGQRPGGGNQVRPVPKAGEGKAPPSAQARTAMEATAAKYDKTIAAARKLLANPALATITGNIQGNLPDIVLSVVSQDAANAIADYNYLITTAGFQELKAMRDASPTGGALGQVSDSENKLLQQSAFTSARAQDEEKFKQSVREYISILEGSKRRVMDAYQRDFGGAFAPAAKAPGTNAPAANAPATKRAPSKPPPGVTALEWKHMTPRERAAWGN